MDPDTNLERQREIAQEIVTIIDSSEGDDWSETERSVLEQVSALANELADLVSALDEWITKGGFLPAEWTRSEQPPSVRPQDHDSPYDDDPGFWYENPPNESGVRES